MPLVSGNKVLVSQLIKDNSKLRGAVGTWIISLSAYVLVGIYYNLALGLTMVALYLVFLVSTGKTRIYYDRNFKGHFIVFYMDGEELAYEFDSIPYSTGENKIQLHVALGGWFKKSSFYYADVLETLYNPLEDWKVEGLDPIQWIWVRICLDGRAGKEKVLISIIDALKIVKEHGSSNMTIGQIISNKYETIARLKEDLRMAEQTSVKRANLIEKAIRQIAGSVRRSVDGARIKEELQNGYLDTVPEDERNEVSALLTHSRPGPRRVN